MKQLVLLIFLTLLSLPKAQTQHELLPYDPVATPASVVTSGNARFTVLTPQLLRLEYSNSGSFEDRATLAFLNRNLPTPKFQTSTANGLLTLETSYLKLQYQVGSNFNSTTLRISSSLNMFAPWYYGKPNPGNLLGTIKSLDQLGVTSLNCSVNANITIHDESLHCEWGLISRDGWAVVDDTSNYALDANDWWAGPNMDTIDLYFFGHGLNYPQALYDYSLVGGKIAMVPRYAGGIWWSIWYNLNNFDVRQIVNTYRSHSLPLDVYVFDMDWHTKEGWGGYSFDTRLFPVPSATLGWLKSQGLAITANLHDADGIRPTENMYQRLAQAIGWNPSSGTIPLNLINSTVAYAMEDIVLNDVERQGMDFWWIDWQQGGKQGGLAGGKQNPTIWLNHLRSTDHIRRGENQRGLVLARWGGLGTHRYQVGFSGDVQDVTWENLAYQPYFSLTGSNVLYGFWSHDIVGPAEDHELHTRWIQWGVYSGVFRTHDRGMSAGGCADTNPSSCGIVAVWKVPDPYFEVNRQALLARAKLLPYIYNATRQAFDSGISLIRPMYYNFPEYNYAYLADQNGNFAQYFFGDHMFVAPVLNPASSTNSMATKSIWIPPGTWIEKDTGALITGSYNYILRKSFDLGEIPVYVRAGAIIPESPVRPGDTIGLSIRQLTTLELSIYPGASSFSTNIYEDDGLTTAYLANKFTWTNVQYTRDASSITISIVTTGSYPEFPDQRNYVIRLVNSLPILSASVNGQVIYYSSTGGANTWRYDGSYVTTVIETVQLSTNMPTTIKVTTDPVDDYLLSGIRGGILHANLAKQNLDASRVTPGAHTVSGGLISDVASTGEYLSYLAGTDLNRFRSALYSFRSNFTSAVAEIRALQPSINKDRWAYSIELLNNAFN